jgi:hypothetical protein
MLPGKRLCCSPVLRTILGLRSVFTRSFACVTAQAPPCGGRKCEHTRASMRRCGPARTLPSPRFQAVPTVRRVPDTRRDWSPSVFQTMRSRAVIAHPPVTDAATGPRTPPRPRCAMQRLAEESQPRHARRVDQYESIRRRTAAGAERHPVAPCPGAPWARTSFTSPATRAPSQDAPAARWETTGISEVIPARRGRFWAV